MTVRHFAPLTALLLVAGLSLGQGVPKKDAARKEPSKPAPGSLEETLEKALRNSADIRSAEVKVREAEAELNRVRQQVLTRATAVHSDLKLARRMLAVAEQTLQAANLRTGKVGPGGDTAAIDARTQAILAAEAMVEKHRGEVEKLEAELKSLRGEFAVRYAPIVGAVFDPDGKRLAGAASDGTVRVWDATTGAVITDLTGAFLDPARAAPKAAAVQAPMAERVKKLLDQELDIDTEIPVSQALRAILETSKVDIPVRELLPKQLEGTVALKGKMPLGAWIQAIEDTDPSLVILVRDYGLLFTTRDRMPEGALRVQDLWKANYAQPHRPDAKGPEKK